MIVTTAAPCRAETAEAKNDSSRSGAAWLAGGLTALVPLIAGGMIMSSGNGPSWKQAGADISLAGFALAPLAAHWAVDEPVRGVLFSALPAATATEFSIYGVKHSTLVRQGRQGERSTYAVLYTATIAASLLGMVDAFFAEGRRVRVTPQVTSGGAGLSVGGVL